MGSEIIEIESIWAITNTNVESEELVVMVVVVVVVLKRSGGGVGGGFLGSLLGETSVLKKGRRARARPLLT